MSKKVTMIQDQPKRLDAILLDYMEAIHRVDPGLCPHACMVHLREYVRMQLDYIQSQVIDKLPGICCAPMQTEDWELVNLPTGKLAGNHRPNP